MVVMVVVMEGGWDSGEEEPFMLVIPPYNFYSH